MLAKRKKAKSAPKRLNSKISKNSKKSNLGGAPTKYDEKYCSEMISFCGKELGNTLEAFACSINVHVCLLHEWAKVHPKFSESKKVAKAKQEKLIADLGLKRMQGKNGK